jgi:HD superfamily phosphohydrolase
VVNIKIMEKVFKVYKDLFGFSHIIDGPYDENKRIGNDVFYNLIINKDGKEVKREIVSFPTKPNYNDLVKLMSKKAANIIRKIRPAREHEVTRAFDSYRRSQKNESFFSFFKKKVELNP